MKLLTGQWIFNQKYNNERETVRFKARWIVRGFLQKKGIYYNLTYAAMISGPIIRAIIAIATVKHWFIYQFDIVTAFLNGQLPETEIIYMPQPTGFKEGRGDLVYKVR